MKAFLTTVLFINLALHAVAGSIDSLRYSRNQIKTDLAYLFTDAAEIHPNLYHSITPTRLNARLDSLINTLPDSLSAMQAYRVFAEATAYIGEGHTGCNMPSVVKQQMDDKIYSYCPLLVKQYNGTSFKGDLLTSKGLQAGVEVLSINGRAASSLPEQMLKYRGGLRPMREQVVISMFPFYLPVMGIKAPYTVVYKDVQGNKNRIVLNNITNGGYERVMQKHAENSQGSFRLLDDGAGYFNFTSMMGNYDRFTHLTDSLFRYLNEHHIGKLIIDLRQNSGGNSGLGRYVLDYIASRPYRMSGGAQMKVTQQFKSYMQQPSLKEVYADKLKMVADVANGTLMKMDADNMTQPRMQNKYLGKVCFLIGPYTFSSANMLAATIKDYHLSTLIGEDTGEIPNDYGETCSFTLPATGFIAFTSTTLWIRPNGNINDNEPVHPDYKVVQTSAKGDDVIRFAQQWLNR